MRTYVVVTLVVSVLIGLAATLRADEEPSALEVAKRTIREHELTIHLLEKRVHSQDVLAKALFTRLEKEFKALRAWRMETATGVDLVKRQIRDLQDALETEQERNGVSKDELGKQLMAEQQRHVADVVQLQQELCVANETAEGNRLEATNALQRAAVIEEEMLRQRDHFVHAVRLLGEIGAPAKIALPWLKQTSEIGDGVLGPAARTAITRIADKPDTE